MGKKARMETLEVIHSEELERPSSRQEQLARMEARRELESLKQARTVSCNDDSDVAINQVLKTGLATTNEPDVKGVRFNVKENVEETEKVNDTCEQPKEKEKSKLQQFKSKTEKEVGK